MDKITMALQKSFEGYTLKDYIRLIIIIGTYILFRNRYVFWRTERYNKAQLEEDERLKKDAEEEKFKEERAKMDGTVSQQTANEFGWGNNAKNRLAKRRKYQESQARRQAEMKQDDSDDEIAHLLKD